MTKFHQRILKIFSANAVSIEPSFLRQFCWDSDQNSFDSPILDCLQGFIYAFKLIAPCSKISDCRKLKVHSPKLTGPAMTTIHKPTGFDSRPTGYQHPPDRSFLFCILRHLYPCIPPSILSCRHWHPTDMKRFFYNAFIHLRIFHFYC